MTTIKCQWENLDGSTSKCGTAVFVCKKFPFTGKKVCQFHRDIICSATSMHTGDFDLIPKEKPQTHTPNPPTFVSSSKCQWICLDQNYHPSGITCKNTASHTCTKLPFESRNFCTLHRDLIIDCTINIQKSDFTPFPQAPPPPQSQDLRQFFIIKFHDTSKPQLVYGPDTETNTIAKFNKLFPKDSFCLKPSAIIHPDQTYPHCPF